MKRAVSDRAYRVAAAETVLADGGRAADYVSSFEVRVADVAAHSAEQWARSIFEGAPRAWRWLLIFGWRAVLLLRLGPFRSADHVLGWRIAATTPSALTLQVRSTLVTADKVIVVGERRLTVTTLVRYERRLGRLVWSALAPVHLLIEPLLITRAASS